MSIMNRITCRTNLKLRRDRRPRAARAGAVYAIPKHSKRINERVWVCRCPMLCPGRIVGLLVCVSGVLDVPLAFVPVNARQGYRRALIAALSVAKDTTRPARADLVDLLACGEALPMPGWIYALECVPLVEPHSRPRTPMPYCPRLSARMAEIDRILGRATAV